MDFEDISMAGIIFGLVGFGVAVIVAKQMDATVMMRIISGLVTGIACYFVGGKIVDSG